MFLGACLRLAALPGGFVELRFARGDPAIEPFDCQGIDELRAVVAILADEPAVRGVLVTNANDGILFGAGAFEGEARFDRPEDELARDLWTSNEALMAFEDLQIPSVVALDGDALGASCELALTAAWRVMAEDAYIGVSDAALGRLPRLGGTVRLPRVASPAVAIDWIASGRHHDAATALAAGVVDAVRPRAAVRATCIDWLSSAARGDVDWRTRQVAKRAPVSMPLAAHRLLFERATDACEIATRSKHPLVARTAVDLMARTTLLPRDAAQWQECEAFARVARSHHHRHEVPA